jgi:hypothetical protein
LELSLKAAVSALMGGIHGATRLPCYTAARQILAKPVSQGGPYRSIAERNAQWIYRALRLELLD